MSNLRGLNKWMSLCYLVSQYVTTVRKFVQGCRRTKHKTYSILDNQWVIMSTSNKFKYFKLEDKKFTAQLIFRKGCCISNYPYFQN